MIKAKKINRNTYYFHIKGFEHYPAHVHVCRNKKNCENELVIDIENLSIMQGNVKWAKIVLEFLKNNPNFVLDLKKEFYKINDHLKKNNNEKR